LPYKEKEGLKMRIQNLIYETKMKLLPTNQRGLSNTRATGSCPSFDSHQSTFDTDLSYENPPADFELSLDLSDECHALSNNRFLSNANPSSLQRASKSIDNQLKCASSVPFVQSQSSPMSTQTACVTSTNTITTHTAPVISTTLPVNVVQTACTVPDATTRPAIEQPAQDNSASLMVVQSAPITNILTKEDQLAHDSNASPVVTQSAPISSIQIVVAQTAHTSAVQHAMYQTIPVASTHLAACIPQHAGNSYPAAEFYSSDSIKKPATSQPVVYRSTSDSDIQSAVQQSTFVRTTSYQPVCITSNQSAVYRPECVTGTQQSQPVTSQHAVYQTAVCQYSPVTSQPAVCESSYVNSQPAVCQSSYVNSQPAVCQSLYVTSQPANVLA
jgi:hypothetical protein